MKNLMTEPLPSMPTRPIAKRVALLVLLMGLAGLCHFNRVSISVAGTERWMKEFSFSEEGLGVLYSSYLVVYTIGMIPGGWLIDRHGPKIALGVMGLASAVLVAATGLTGFVVASSSASFALLLVIRSFLGLASVPMHPAAAQSVSLWFSPASRAWANSAVTAAALVGITLTYPLFGHLIDELGWPNAFVASGVITAIVAILWVGIASDGRVLGTNDKISPKVPSTDAQSANARASRTDYRSLALLTASYAAVGYFQYLFFYWIQYYFKEVLDLGVERSRTLAMIPMLSMAAGMLVGGWAASRLQVRLGRWHGLVAVPMFGMVAGAAFAWIGVVTTNLAWIVSCFSLAMGAIGMAEGPFWTVAIELGGKRGGASAAIFNTGGNAGGLLAPVVTPYFSGYFGWRAGIALAGGFCLLGGLFWLWIRPAEPQEEPRD